MSHEVTTQEILEAINVFSSNVDKRFDRLEADVAVLKTDVAVLKTDVAVLKQDVSVLKQDMIVVKSTMATKDDVVVLTRQEDRKLGALIDELVARRVLDRPAADKILSMTPFGLNA